MGPRSTMSHGRLAATDLTSGLAPAGQATTPVSNVAESDDAGHEAQAAATPLGRDHQCDVLYHRPGRVDVRRRDGDAHGPRRSRGDQPLQRADARAGAARRNLSRAVFERGLHHVREGADVARRHRRARSGGDAEPGARSAGTAAGAGWRLAPQLLQKFA